MDMVRHYYKFVKLIEALIAVFEEGAGYNLRIFGHLEYGAVFGAFGCDEVGAAGLGSVFELRHFKLSSAAEAAFPGLLLCWG